MKEIAVAYISLESELINQIAQAIRTSAPPYIHSYLPNKSHTLNQSAMWPFKWIGIVRLTEMYEGFLSTSIYVHKSRQFFGIWTQVYIMYLFNSLPLRFTELPEVQVPCGIPCRYRRISWLLLEAVFWHLLQQRFLPCIAICVVLTATRPWPH